MQERIRVQTNAPWEDTIGYCRVLRIGNLIEIAGTTAVDQMGRTVGAGDPYAQAKFIIQKIKMAMAEVSADLDHIVRTRILLTDIAHWPEVAKAHKEHFDTSRPVNTLVAVAALIQKDLLVEIEATAILSD